MSNGVALAVDVGGTKIAAALVRSDGTLLTKQQVPTPRTDDGDEIFDALAAAVNAVRPEGAIVGVGLGCAGPVDLRAGTVKPVNIHGWRDYPLRERVAALLPSSPVWLLGDGLAIALGEHRFGAARGTQSSLSMVVSTGVGGGLVLDGQPYAGPTGNAGHIGHIVVQVGGDRCPCGSHGCLETIASGTNIARWALAQGWQPSSDSTARGVFLDAGNGDRVAQASIARAADALGAAIVSASAMVDLDRVVIGGGVAQAGEPFFAAVREGVRAYAGMAFTQRIEIVPAELGTTAGLVGAAALAFDRA